VPTRTVTNYNQGPTVTVQSTILRTATDGQVTSQWQTTLTSTATCHYPGSGFPSAPSASFCLGASCQTFGPGQRPDEVVNPTVAAEKRDVATVAAIGAVAAVTSTYTQTTYTVTSTLQTTIPGRTVTENGKQNAQLSILYLAIAMLTTRCSSPDRHRYHVRPYL